jgi:hypothetical protein
MAKKAVRALDSALFVVWIAVTLTWVILLIPYALVLGILWLCRLPLRASRGQYGREWEIEALRAAKRRLEAPAVARPPKAGLQP